MKIENFLPYFKIIASALSSLVSLVIALKCRTLIKVFIMISVLFVIITVFFTMQYIINTEQKENKAISLGSENIDINYNGTVQQTEEDETSIPIQYFGKNIVSFRTKRDVVEVDLLSDNSYQYSIWSVDDNQNNSPDLILRNGWRDVKKDSIYFIFKNTGSFIYEIEFIHSINNGKLAVYRNGASLQEWGINNISICFMIFMTERNVVRIDFLNDNSYKYSAWDIKKGFKEEPDIVLYDGIRKTNDNNRIDYIFTNPGNQSYMYKIEYFFKTNKGKISVFQNDDILQELEIKKNLYFFQIR